jgi:nucleotide-binding universal stress UspA family protein
LIQIKRRVRLVRVFFPNSFFLFAFAEMGSQMYKRILVAVDGSETANAALQEAVMLAKNHNSEIKLLHVVDQTMAYSVVDAPYVFEYRKAMEEEGKKVLAESEALPRSAGIQCETKCVVTFGKAVYDLIEEEATEWSADLIVVGTHGRRGIRRLLLGSVAEGLTRISRKPILLVRGT